MFHIKPLNLLCLHPQWHSLSREEQAKYYELARKERQLHSQLYPGWSARDNYVSGLALRFVSVTLLRLLGPGAVDEKQILTALSCLQGKRKKRKRDNKPDSKPEGKTSFLSRTRLDLFCFSFGIRTNEFAQSVCFRVQTVTLHLDSIVYFTLFPARVSSLSTNTSPSTSFPASTLFDKQLMRFSANSGRYVCCCATE